VEVAPRSCDLSGSLPFPVKGIGSNVFCWIAKPRMTTVSRLRVGPLQIAAVPAEVATSLGTAWRSALGGDAIVGFADDYVGAIESPGSIDSQTGAARRDYFGEKHAASVLQGLMAAHP
jgi:hypothetical protein